VEKIQESFGLDLDEDDDWLFIKKMKEDVDTRASWMHNN